MAKLGQYLVTIRKPAAKKDTPQGELLEKFIKQLEQTPEAEIVKRGIGIPLVIRATEQTVNRLRLQYGDQLIIEPDAELNMFTA
jgi:hypothetical protein